MQGLLKLRPFEPEVPELFTTDDEPEVPKLLTTDEDGMMVGEFGLEVAKDLTEVGLEVAEELTEARSWCSSTHSQTDSSYHRPM